MSVVADQAASASMNAARVAREQVRLAFGTWVQYVDGRVFSCAITFLMCGGVPSIGRTAPLIGALWLSADFCWSAASSIVARAYFRHEAKRSPLFWRALLHVIWITHALLWGTALIVFWDPANPANEAVLIVMTMGVMVSCFATLAPCFSVLLTTLLTISVVSWTGVLAAGGVLGSAYLVMHPVFMLLLTNYGYQASRKYHNALKLRFDNESLAAALLKANRSKSSFLASMSHELRTPLNAILGYSDLIRQRTFGPIAPARYAACVEDIHASGVHLLKLINDLLDLAKIEAGKREFVFVPVDLQGIAQEAAKLVEPQSERALVSVMFNFKHQAVVEADERAVKQILTNLLSNAVKFSRPGALAVAFCEVLADDRIAFGVRDTGEGMTPEEQLKAIEPFAQGSDVYTVEGRGTGLGLPIVKGLIEAHQGRLKIESTPGTGSKIWVEFPPERLLGKAAAA